MGTEKEVAGAESKKKSKKSKKGAMKEEPAEPSKDVSQESVQTAAPARKKLPPPDDDPINVETFQAESLAVEEVQVRQVDGAV